MTLQWEDESEGPQLVEMENEEVSVGDETHGARRIRFDERYNIALKKESHNIIFKMSFFTKGG